MTTYLNTIPTAGQVRRPRAILMMGNVPIDFDRITITHSGTHQAGTFAATVRTLPGKDVGQWGWWFSTALITLDVFAGFPADPLNFTTSDLTQIGTYRIDSVKLDTAKNTITLQGRDMSALLLDAKASANYQNQTSSQVATNFATAAGLTPNVTATTTKIGTFFATDSVHLKHEQTQWALLAYLARKEGFGLHVVGRTLYFGNFTDLQNSSYLIQFAPGTPQSPAHASNAVKLEFEHDLTLARDVIVTVRSTNLQSGKSFSVQAKAARSALKAATSLTPVTPGPTGDVQNYVYTIPHLTPQAAKAKALELAKTISDHELRMEAELPGDAVLYPWVPVQVVGTGTDFDQTYNISHISREIEPRRFSMTIRAKNHPTETQVSLA